MQKRNFFLLLCLLFISLAGTAQSVYNLKYNFGEKETFQQFDAFLVRYDDGTGFIRVRYKDLETKEDAVVEMDTKEDYYRDKKTGKADSNILIIEGMDPRIVIGDTSLFYPPDQFWLRYDEKTNYYEPATVYTLNDDDEEEEGEFQSAELVEDKDLTQAFVSQFFDKDDEFYLNLFDVASVRPIQPDEKKTKLFLLIAANTEDEDIGTTCVKDKDRTYKTFADLSEFLEIQFVPKVIYGKEYNKKNVDDAINALKPGAKDIVIFYYTGHGFNKAQGEKIFPYIALTTKSFESLDANSLSMEDIFERIKNKGARLNLVLSDCCNADPNAVNNNVGDIAVTRPSPIAWDINNCRTLFLNDKPVSILMTAASKGELSAGTGTLGGIFTYFFRASMVNYMGKFQQTASWQKILFDAKNQTIVRARNTDCKNPDGTVNKCNQHPVFVIR